MVLIILMVQQKKVSIDFSKANIKLCLTLHYNGDESYLHVNKTEIFKFKVKGNIRWYIFCLGSVPTIYWVYYILYTLSASSAHGLIAQLVRASKRNSLLMSSNPTQANFLQLLLRILQWWIPYVSVHSAALMWLPARDFA